MCGVWAALVRQWWRSSTSSRAPMPRETRASLDILQASLTTPEWPRVPEHEPTYG